MAFFPRNFVNITDASFTPLFRLLDDFDKFSRHAGAPSLNGRRSSLAQWQPKFDVRETADTYELYGELPGMDKDNVSIEFPEAQTMHIRGKVERVYTTDSSTTGQLEDTAMSGAITDSADQQNHHKATVEDKVEADAKDAGEPTAEVVETNDVKKPADQDKYWLSERSIGEFSRSFNFPSRVDQDGVSANLKDGLLTVTVPKAKKHESRRIAVQ